MPAHRRLQPFASTLLIGALAVGAAACSSSGSKGAAKATPTSSGSLVSGTGVVNSPSNDSGGDGPNPCTIVSASDVKAMMGATTTPSGPKSENRGRQCTWRGNGSSVLVQVYKGEEFYDPSVQAPSAKKLTGLGDDAYLDDFGTTRVAVGFLKGDTAVFIDGLQITSSDAVVAAARDAAANV